MTFIAALVSSYVALSLYIAYDLPQSDHWEWMHKLLIPFINGEIDLLAYLSGAFKPFLHSHIATLSFQLLNYELFGLRYDMESFFGLVALLLTAFVLLRRFWRTASSELQFRYLVSGDLRTVGGPY